VLTLPVSSTTACWDAYRGASLTSSSATLNLDAFGYGAVLCLPTKRSQSDPILAQYMSTMATLTQTPLSSLSTNTPVLSQTMVVYSAPASGMSTSDMTLIPSNTNYAFYATGVEIEGQQRPGVDFQYFWESQPQLTHSTTFNLPAFYINTYPITNSDYAAFMKATHYTPKVSKNFLRDWNGGTYRSGWANKPVTWVSIDDASAYCTWRGGRLPNEWEWQYAAQGNDGRSYPWGSTFDSSRVATPFTGRTLPGPDDVGQRPSGASPYGVQDLVGLVWQWTNSFADTHTRAASVKGGSYYRPQGSRWYFPNAQKVYEHGKLLLISPSLDRSACIGFRCVIET